jgi:hypothetical protein
MAWSMRRQEGLDMSKTLPEFHLGLSSLVLLAWLLRVVSWVFFLCLTFWALWFLWFADRHPLDK